MRQRSDYLGDDLGDVFQRLFDGVFGHVPLKSGDISDQVDCEGENKSSTLSSSISTDPYVWITHLIIHNLSCFCFLLLCVSFSGRRLTVVTSVSKQVLLNFVPAVFQNVGHVLSNLLHHTGTQSRTNGVVFCHRSRYEIKYQAEELPFNKSV